jgi:hypothetical protein
MGWVWFTVSSKVGQKPLTGNGNSMKKTLLYSSIQIAAVASALAQGTVSFENALSTGIVYVGLGNNPPYSSGSTITLALLWAPGTSFVPQNALTQIGTYTFVNNAGFFQDPSTITTGTATAPGTAAIFEVQGWLGTYANYAAAIAAGASQVAETAEFVNGTSNPTGFPPPPPTNTTGWDGNLMIMPEPSTMALGAIGAAVVWMWRRKNMIRTKSKKQESI